jgi:hypothetical protein
VQRIYRFLTRRSEAGPARQQPERGAEVRFTISPDARASQDQAGIVFLHVGSGAVFSSNCIGARIWRGLRDHDGLETIAADISGEYGVPREQVRQDAAGFVADLEAKGLLARHIGG